jgi:hypothetical protein
MLRETLKLRIALGTSLVVTGCTTLLGADGDYTLGGSGGSSTTATSGSAGGHAPSGTSAGSAGGEASGDTSAGSAGGETSGGGGAGGEPAGSGGSGGDPGELPCGPGTLIDLSDDFRDRSRSMTLWDTSGSTAQTDGDVRMASSGTYSSKRGYALESCGASIRITGAEPSSTNLWFQLNQLGNASIQAVFTKTDQLQAEIKGNYELVAQLPYDATEHAWLRIRATTDTVFWEASRDGADWNQVASRPLSRVSFSDTRKIQVNFGVGAAASTVHFDNFNVPP